MLSNPSSSIQKRRQMHRRQNSTPSLEVVNMPSLPAIPQKKIQHRRGMSLDQRVSVIAPFPDRTITANNRPRSQDSHMVSITNIGQQQPQHSVQVTQQHVQAQPGTQYQKEVQKQEPQTRPQPSEEQIRNLQEQIRSVYGVEGAFIVLPGAVPAPTKTSPQVKTEHLDIAPMPSSLNDLPEINLEPMSVGNSFDFKMGSQGGDVGYESSYYSASPGRSPMASPHQRSVATFQGHNSRLGISGVPLLPVAENMNDFDAFLASPTRSPLSPGAMSMTDLNLGFDASIEATGISPEEVQSYISEQDQSTHRWTCLYPGCDKTFGRRENIRSHVQTHLGDRQFRCNHCGKCFVRQHDLKRHSKIHTGDKPYKCPCGGGFARQDALTRHRQRGVCEGGFPSAAKSTARRGRPKKQRPDLEERADKANRTRRALAYASSSSGASQCSDVFSPTGSFDDYDPTRIEFTDLRSLEAQPSEPASDPFSFDTTSSPYNSDAIDTAATSFDLKAATDNLFQLSTEAFTQTPPMSPTNQSPEANENAVLELLKSSEPNSKAGPPSNHLTTPPTSPAQFFDELDQAVASYGNSNQAMDFSMFCDAGDGTVSSPEEIFSSMTPEEALATSMAWIDAL